jgi:hypothetical protein
MSRPRPLAILGVMTVVIAAAVPASASAEPVFLTKAVVGEAVSSVPFSGTIGATFWEGKTSKAKISCSSGTITGEVTGARTVANTLLVFHGCESGGCAANTVGHPTGEVVSHALAGKLNGITSTKPGLKLFSQTEGKGGRLMDWVVCGGAVSAVQTGEVTGALSGASGEGPSTGKLVSSIKLTLAETAGVQKYQGFFEGEEAGLMGQVTDTINGTPELEGWSWIATNKTVPSTWGLGVTK